MILPKVHIERDNGVLKISISRQKYSDCCNAKPIPEASEEANFCGNCGDHAQFWQAIKIIRK